MEIDKEKEISMTQKEIAGLQAEHARVQQSLNLILTEIVKKQGYIEGLQKSEVPAE